MRNWLNTAFVSSAFTQSERDMIDYVQMEDGCDDEVFLLSKEEILSENLFEDDDARMCGKSYWLRSLAGYGDKANTVDMYGFTSWKYKDQKGVGIRPAMCVGLNKYE